MELCVTRLLLTHSCVCVCVQQCQGNASAVVQQSKTEPRQIRSRWAEPTDAVIICSGSSPDGEEEEDEDFLPQSLEELLGEVEEDEEKQAGGEGRSYVLYDANTYSDR